MHDKGSIMMKNSHVRNMPHIHSLPGQCDFTAEVFIVYQDKVLLRFHDKYHKWLAVGGHIE